jgi:hypothetical protein
MSSRPRTPVEIRVNPIDTRLAVFSLANLAPELSRLRQGRTRATQRQTLATFVCRGDLTSLAERLDRAWAPRALRGAALLYAGIASPHLRGRACRDALLVLNVLARARGNVLLPDAPLVLQAGALNRHVVTDDPRLTALVYRESEGDA